MLLFYLLTVALVFVAIASDNWRLRTIATIFAISIFISNLFGPDLHWLIDLAMSASILAVLVFLQFRRRSEPSKPYFMLPLILAESMILISHFSLLFYSYWVFWYIVHILFAFELVYSIGYGLFVSYKRFVPKHSL